MSYSFEDQQLLNTEVEKLKRKKNHIYGNLSYDEILQVAQAKGHLSLNAVDAKKEK